MADEGLDRGRRAAPDAADTAHARDDARLAAAAAERRAARLLEQMSEAHVVLDAELRIVAANAAAERAVGVARDAFVGRTPWDVWPASADSEMQRQFARVRDDGVETHFGFHYAGPDRDVHVDIDAYATDEGGVAVFWRDVTRERAAAAERERLLRAESRARALAEAAHERTLRLQALTAALGRARTVDDVATVIVSVMSRVLDARTAALSVPSPGGDAMVLLRTEGFPADTRSRVAQQPLDMRSPLVESFVSRVPIWIESRDGPAGLDVRYPPIAPVWDSLGVASAAFVPLVVADEVVGVISFSWPGPRRLPPGERAFLLALGGQAALAMERARLFDAERAARQDAERANRTKSEFLATMSHELRTPLNAIAGYAELMELGIRGPVSDAQREDLRRIRVSQRHLLGLINEVLNYAKLETGTVHFERERVPLREALAASVGLIAPQAQTKGIALGVGACDAGLAARADADKVRQVVVNLLSNAVKFTDRGGSVRVDAEARGDDRVAVRVRDTGLGIAADQLDRIFEPFVQVRADLTRMAEGTGLGLAISRDLARGMGGELSAESEAGAGSTFTLTLPAD